MVQLQLATRNGTPLGTTQPLNIESTRFGRALLIVIAAALGVLVLLSLRRGGNGGRGARASAKLRRQIGRNRMTRPTRPADPPDRRRGARSRVPRRAISRSVPRSRRAITDLPAGTVPVRPPDAASADGTTAHRTSAARRGTVRPSLTPRPATPRLPAPARPRSTPCPARPGRQHRDAPRGPGHGGRRATGGYGPRSRRARDTSRRPRSPGARPRRRPRFCRLPASRSPEPSYSEARAAPGSFPPYPGPRQGQTTAPGSSSPAPSLCRRPGRSGSPRHLP